MINWHEVMKELQNRGLEEINLTKVNKISRKASSVQEAADAYIADDQPKVQDQDLADFTEYNALIRQAKLFAECRAQVGETASAEDISVSASEAEAERTEYTAEIAKLMQETEKHLAVARVWARSCRVELEAMIK